MDVTLVLLFGALASLVGAMILLASTGSALKTGVVGNDILDGGYRRDEQPLSYWYFVTTGTLGGVAFLGLAIFTVRVACGS